jgi:hypothetical protein
MQNPETAPLRLCEKNSPQMSKRAMFIENEMHN